MTECLFSIRAADVPLPADKQPPGWGPNEEHCLCSDEEVGDFPTLSEALQAAGDWALKHDHSPHLLYITEWSLDANGDLNDCLRSMCLEEWEFTNR